MPETLSNHPTAALMLLPPIATESSRHLPVPRNRQDRPPAERHAAEGAGGGQIDVVREQRDGLARGRERLLAAVRRVQAENAALRQELEQYRTFPPAEEQRRELADARRLEREQDIRFAFMPPGVYPGKPYVTQLDLIRRGGTRYSRQNISRLVRQEGSIPALAIADRVLLAPAGVRALLQREARAAADASPRRRPGGRRRTGPRP